MIKLVNIDYRLVHGQVVFGWAKWLQIEHLVIIDDEVIKNDFAMDMLKLGLPNGMDASIVGRNQTKQAVESKAAQTKKTMVILPDPIAALAFVKEIPTDYVNISNVKEKEGSERFSNCCFLNPAEQQAIQEMIAMGIKVDAFSTPGDAKGINLNKICERRMKKNVTHAQ